MLFSRWTVDPVKQANIEKINYAGHSGYRIADDSKRAVLNLAIHNKYIIVLFSGTKYGAYYFIDFYNKNTGNYKFSYKLNKPASSIALLHNNLWVLERDNSETILVSYKL